VFIVNQLELCCGTTNTIENCIAISTQHHSNDDQPLLASLLLSRLHNAMEQTSPNDDTAKIHDNHIIESIPRSTPPQLVDLAMLCSCILNLPP